MYSVDTSSLKHGSMIDRHKCVPQKSGCFTFETTALGEEHRVTEREKHEAARRRVRLRTRRTWALSARKLALKIDAFLSPLHNMHSCRIFCFYSSARSAYTSLQSHFLTIRRHLSSSALAIGTQFD